ncbi:hypothetical protein [Neisseria lactamica]|uniref:hypothetical protein n=1 Tax=Neisseria lactamica TaxID=486 RepID=UPI0027E16F0F|nr:hypothetical protein [Neisseria lactamica]
MPSEGFRRHFLRGFRRRVRVAQTACRRLGTLPHQRGRHAAHRGYILDGCVFNV